MSYSCNTEVMVVTSVLLLYDTKTAGLVVFFRFRFQCKKRHKPDEIIHCSKRLTKTCSDKHLGAEKQQKQTNNFSSVSSHSNPDRKSTRLNSSHVAISYA